MNSKLEKERHEALLAHVAVYLFLTKDEHLLLIRRFNTGWQDGNYTLISGHVDTGETILNAMVREAEEEAGIILQQCDLEVAHVMHRKSSSSSYIDFFLRATLWQGDPHIVEPDKCDNMQWFALSNLPENTLSHVIKAFEYVQQNVYFSEYNI